MLGDEARFGTSHDLAQKLSRYRDAITSDPAHDWLMIQVELELAFVRPGLDTADDTVAEWILAGILHDTQDQAEVTNVDSKHICIQFELDWDP